jgi:membrane dipeptidase
VTVVPVFDGHNDVLLKIHRGEEGFLPHARDGGFAGGLFAVFVPGPAQQEPPDKPSGPYSLPLSPPVDPDEAHETAGRLMEILFRLERDGIVRVVRTADEIEQCIAEGPIAAVLHFEGAEPIRSVADLEPLYEHGLRSLGLVWSRANAYAEGVPFRFPASPDTGQGLTDAGRELVRACNRLGILVDLSHLNERGFFDVAAISDAPLVASHSNAHALCASTRNLTDEQLDAIGASGGIVGINFAVGFLREDGQLDADTPLETIVRHVDYIVERIGIDHIGLGSDFEGALVPQAIGDVRGLPGLFDALQEGGYDSAALRKIGHENWLRVLRATWVE